MYVRKKRGNFMPELEDAVQRLRQDQALADRFIINPLQVLRELEVDTSNLRIQPAPPPPAGRDLEQTRGICVSIGAFVCVDVGT